jgi:hypothetical protein
VKRVSVSPQVSPAKEPVVGDWRDRKTVCRQDQEEEGKGAEEESGVKRRRVAGRGGRNGQCVRRYTSSFSAASCMIRIWIAESVVKA